MIGAAQPSQAGEDVGAYLAARQAATERDFPSAAQYFTRALVSDPSNPEILERALLSHLAMGNIRPGGADRPQDRGRRP